jgi:hypothetical protein
MHSAILRASIVMMLIALAGPLAAQVQTQSVRGAIVDADTRQPLIGATVLLIGSDPLIGATTDLDGRFTLEKVPAGRIALQVRMLGYEEQTLANLLVNSAKELVLDIRLQESLVKLEEVEVSGKKGHGEVRNDMAVMSARKISVEETSRIAGGINDPARMVTVFPGVSGDPTGNNTIIVRGNSPKGVLWRLEGMEIPNPNHFADDGTTGGPINVLNSDVVDNSDFYTGAFAAEYGNVTSAVFDMKLRDGNDRKREYTLKAGVLGTDLTAEGPVPGVPGGSYLANYRYSTLSLLDQAGIVDYQGVPKYTDAAFKLKLPTAKAGTFSLFGIGGRSGIDQKEESELGDTLFASAQYGSRMGVAGITHTLLLGSNNFLYTTASLSGNGSGVDYSESPAPGESPLVLRHETDFARTTMRASTTLNTRINASHKLRTGVILSLDRFRMYANTFDRADSVMKVNLDQRGEATTVQAFASWKWRWNEQWSLTSGVHFLHYALNGASSVEPRAALRYQRTPARAFTFGAGLHSKTESLMNHLVRTTDGEGRSVQRNRSLGLSRAAHAVLGYEQLIMEDVQFKAEAYCQNLYSQPVEDAAGSAFWLGNTQEWYTDKPLVSKGIGYNTGVELSIEKFFTRGWHALATLSVFESRYRAADGTWYNARFGLGAVANALAGKEWKVGKADKDKVLTTGARYSVQGGQWQTPLDANATLAAGYEVESTALMGFKGDPIHKLDLVLAYRIGRAKVSHEFKADVQNVLNAQTVVYSYYNSSTERIEGVSQLAILPVMGYTLRF